MTSKLSSLLVQDGVVSVKRMEEAFQRQVIYGGELDTVLLEMGALDEAVVSRFLQLASGFPTGDLSALKLHELSPLKSVFPQQLAEKYRVVPVCREGKRLLLAVTVAIERGQLEELSFMLNMTLVPNVVPEMRVVQLLNAVYEIPISRRFAGILKKAGDPPALRSAGVPARLLAPSEFMKSAADGAAEPEEEREPEKGAPELVQGSHETSHTPADRHQRETAQTLKGKRFVGPPEAAPPEAAPPEAAPPEAAPPEAAPLVEGFQQQGLSESDGEREPDEIWASGDLGSAEGAPDSSMWQGRTLVGMPTKSEIAEFERGAGSASFDAKGESGQKPSGKLGEEVHSEEYVDVTSKTAEVSEPQFAASETSEEISDKVPEPTMDGQLFEPLPEHPAEGEPPSSYMENAPSYSPPPSLEMDDYPKIIQPQQFAREAKGEIDIRGSSSYAERKSDEFEAPSIEIDLPLDETEPAGVRSKIPAEQRAIAIDISEADEAFKATANRDEILQVLVKVLASRCKYAALFVVQGDHVAGKYAVEKGRLTSTLINRMEIPLQTKSLFKTVVESGSQYFGPVNDEGLNYAILTQLDRLDAPNVLAVPVRIKDRVVCVLYGDCEKELVTSDAVADLAPLPFLGARAFLRILLEAKKGYAAGRTSEDVRIDRSAEALPDKQRGGSSVDVSGAAGIQEATSGQLESKGGEWGAGTTTGEIRMAMREGAAISPGEFASPQSVMVDAAQQAPENLSKEGLEGLVDMLERGSEMGERAGSVLAEAGDAGLDAIMERFPGRLVVDRFAPGAKLPPVSQHGPLLHFLIWYGRGAVDRILPLLKSGDPEKRFYATLLFTEVVSEEALGPLYQRLFDDDGSVRRAAVDALQLNAGEEKMATVLEYLRGVLQQGVPFHKSCGAEALGAFRDGVSVPILINMVDDDSKEVSEAVQRALLLITKQAFGSNKGEWLSWWSRNQGLHRIEWMIDALVHPDVECRFMAAKELKELIGETFGYRFDLPLKERHVAVNRWREWWKGPGKKKFK